jgi:hypothetical protein
LMQAKDLENGSGIKTSTEETMKVGKNAKI